MEDFGKILFYVVIMVMVAGIKALIGWVENRAKGGQNSRPAEFEDYEPEEDESVESSEDSQQSLQDLIRKFQEEQAKTLSEPVEDSTEEPAEELPEDLPEAPVRNFSEEVSAPVLEVPSEPPRRMSAWEAHLQKISAEPEPPEVDLSAAEDVSAFEIADETPAPRRKSGLEFSKREARKGILWSQVLNDPRYRRRSPLPLRGR